MNSTSDFENVHIFYIEFYTVESKMVLNEKILDLKCWSWL